MFGKKKKNTPAIENKKEKDMWEIKTNQAIFSKEGETSKETNKGFTINDEDFGPLMELVKDDTITDIDFNGTDLWITDIYNNHWMDTKLNITPSFIRRLAQGIANSQSKEFNQNKPILEAETDELRISTIHVSKAQTGTTMCIRKTPKKERIKVSEAINAGYASKESFAMLANCVESHMNIIICGEPRAGKTEFAKFISGYIPNNERIITIEDVMEWRCKDLHPTADIIELKVDDNFTYPDAIIASLKQNPKWIMIAETRGEEVKNLIQSFSTGVNGITTLHTDDVKKIPSRIVNMANDSLTESRMSDNVYDYVDVGILISMKPNENGVIQRYIDQVAFFGRDENHKPTITMMVRDGSNTFNANIPRKIKRKLKANNITNMYESESVSKTIERENAVNGGKETYGEK